MNRQNDTTTASLNHTVVHCNTNTANCFFPHVLEPGRNDVIIGRGRKCNKHIGNERLRQIVASRLEEYSAASKDNKTYVISTIIDQIKMGNPKGAFVKQDLSTKLWFDVGDFTAREKISRMFRDALHHNSKSSSLDKKRQKGNEKSNSMITYNRQLYGFIAQETRENPQLFRLWENAKNFGFESPNRPINTINAAKKRLYNPHKNDSFDCKSTYNLFGSEDEYFHIVQTFIDFTKTEEFRKFEISHVIGEE